MAEETSQSETSKPHSPELFCLCWQWCVMFQLLLTMVLALGCVGLAFSEATLFVSKGRWPARG